HAADRRADDDEIRPAGGLCGVMDGGVDRPPSKGDFEVFALAATAGHMGRVTGLTQAHAERGADQPDPDDGDAGHDSSAPTTRRSASRKKRFSSAVPVLTRICMGRPKLRIERTMTPSCSSRWNKSSAAIGLANSTKLA